MTVNVTDGRYTYFRAPVPGNQPCFEYAALPHTIRKKMGSDCPEEIECGRYFKRTKYPLFKIPCRKPAQIEGAEPLAEVSETMLFDLESDYGQVNNLAGKGDAAEQHMIDLLLRGLEEHEAPRRAERAPGPRLRRRRRLCGPDAAPSGKVVVSGLRSEGDPVRRGRVPCARSISAS